MTSMETWIDRLADMLCRERILGWRRLARTVGARTWPAGVVVVAWLLWPAPRPWPASLLGGAAAAIGGAIWLRALALLLSFRILLARHDRDARRRHYQDYAPPLTAAGAIAWNDLCDYMAVAEAAGAQRQSSFRAILDGPLRRYLDLCADEAEPRAVRARTMEFARGMIRDYGRRRPWMARRADRLVKEELERRFGAGNRWLIAVYEGRLNHHATRLPAEDEAAA